MLQTLSLVAHLSCYPFYGTSSLFYNAEIENVLCINVFSGTECANFSEML